MHMTNSYCFQGQSFYSCLCLCTYFGNTVHFECLWNSKKYHTRGQISLRSFWWEKNLWEEYPLLIEAFKIMTDLLPVPGIA